jgi:hypothetical protein
MMVWNILLKSIEHGVKKCCMDTTVEQIMLVVLAKTCIMVVSS